MNKLKFTIMALLSIMLILPFMSSLETAQISYVQKVDYQPFCISNCTSNEQIVNGTNFTSTSCTEKCFANLNISLKFPGDENWREPYFIDTSSSLYKTPTTFQNTGTYITTLGNSSDVTGLNDKIINLTSTINNKLIECFNDKAGIQSNATQTVSLCEDNLDNMNRALSEKNNAFLEAEKKVKQRGWFLGAGIVIGIIFLRFVEPYLKGRTPKRDPNEQGQSSYEGKY